MLGHIDPSELQCTVAVERLNPAGQAIKRQLIRKASVTLGRNEFQEMVLRVHDGKAPQNFMLREFQLFTRFAKDGKCTVKFIPENTQVLVSDCPPDRLKMFLKTLSIKHQASQGIKPMSDRDKLRAGLPRAFETLSPLQLKDVQKANELRSKVNAPVQPKGPLERTVNKILGERKQVKRPRPDCDVSPVNSNDDKGVLMGNWSGNYSDGVNPSMWTGSADILKKWAETRFSPVKYGQCWVFAAVMCTVMRALGIPTRVITNFNSAHDTDGNMVIEEYYDGNGKKLPISGDSIWNFHVWVESWMKRPDLGRGYDGWQALDATPQERSTGMFRCGPASVKAVYQRKVEAQYDVPFVYAEVNADVHEMVVRDRKVLSKTVDKHRVGSLILTKLPGSMCRQDITSEYKNESADMPFWESHAAAVTAKHEITFKEYMLKEAADVFLVNLAVVIEDLKSQEKVLASEEFNIRSPTLSVQIQNESSVIIYTPQVATVTFVNPFNTAVSGELTISGSGLLEEKAKMRVTIQPRETMKKPVNFTPRMAGSKMLSANLVLTNPPTILHGFTTINVQRS
ncbi:glutamine gamma-glutamyltransferase [Labeo rohita]|uniref:Glutamine gamma-glutamyltransferase n=1 Tax=Labeo rohita TaxID=84645 RepID=A0A498NAQ2_LABRO|nr:glutamine gamma-glutamyltransferase [Labeo rohita]